MFLEFSFLQVVIPSSICLLLTTFLWCSDAFAQIQEEDAIKDALNGIYATVAAKPSLEHRGELAQRLEKTMFNQSRYLISTLHPWEKDEKALLLTTGKSGEHGIRPNGHTVYGLAIMYRCFPDEAFSKQLTREDCRDTIIAMLRFVLPTHGAGEMLCANDRPWHNQWQSALWADAIGKACWLLWDDLPDDLRWLAARMICDEADRFVDLEPPAQIEYDTKAEENAWNSRVISLAYNMFPDHPRHERWGQAAIRWQVSSFIREADLLENPVIDGKPLKDWFDKANIYDDYTLENHGKVHPDYMNTTAILSDQVPTYLWGGNKIPEALFFNSKEVYLNLKRLSAHDGGFIYPSGQDWRLHRNADWVRAHTCQAILNNDPEAARLARICQETAELMAARAPDGGLYLPEEYHFPSTQHFLLEGSGLSYLLSRHYGDGATPVSEEALWDSVSGKHVFDSGKLAVIRTEKAVSTFSWGKLVMGMTFPLQKDLLIAPYERSLIGDIQVDGKVDRKIKLTDHKIASVGDAFGISGVIDRCDGLLQQKFGFVALPDGRTIYVDSVSALKDVDNITSLELGIVSVLNEPRWVFHDGARFLRWSGSKQIIPAQGETEPPLFLNSNWYNIDDEMGIVCLAGSGEQRYERNRKVSRGRVQQLFSLNYINTEKLTGCPEGPLAKTVLVLYPGADSKQTEKAASKCSLKHEDGTDQYAITLDDGLGIQIDLGELDILLQ